MPTVTVAISTYLIKLIGHQRDLFTNTSKKIDTYFGMLVVLDGPLGNEPTSHPGAIGTEVSTESKSLWNR